MTTPVVKRSVRLKNRYRIFEDFSAGLPADIWRTSDVVADNSIGRPAPSLRTDGLDSRWFGAPGSRWQISGDFRLSLDIMLNPDGSTTREIQNIAFWVNNHTNTSLFGPYTGFCYRIQSASNDGGFMRLNNGSHTTMTGSMGVAPHPVATWMRFRLTLRSGVAEAVVTRLSDNATLSTKTFDLNPHVSSSHPQSGCFGQHKDAAGSASGSRWDNIIVT